MILCVRKRKNSYLCTQLGRADELGTVCSDTCGTDCSASMVPITVIHLVPIQRYQQQGADKGEGLLAMAKHQGLDPQYTMAFGDGGNDTTMIRKAGIGVAMGNAIDELKKEADFVTTTVDEDGIQYALRHFGLI